MSLEPRILAKIDNRLRSDLRKGKSSLTARVPVSEMQWSVWKRYCEMVGVSAGGGLAVLVDHELASVIEEDVETLTQSVKSREAALAAREGELAEREEAVEKRERFCDFQERQLESQRRRLDEKERQLESKHQALEVLATGSRPRAPVRAQLRPGRNQLCWCDSGKKYKNCHLDWDQRNS
jgi:hypothetical protein